MNQNLILIYLLSNITVCPRSSDPFYIISYYIQNGSLLHGHTVYCHKVFDSKKISLATFSNSLPKQFPRHTASPRSVELYDHTQGTWSSQPDLSRDIDPYSPLFLNWDGQVLTLFHKEDQIYKRSEENGK